MIQNIKKRFKIKKERKLTNFDLCRTNLQKKQWANRTFDHKLQRIKTRKFRKQTKNKKPITRTQIELKKNQAMQKEDKTVEQKNFETFFESQDKQKTFFTRLFLTRFVRFFAQAQQSLFSNHFLCLLYWPPLNIYGRGLVDLVVSGLTMPLTTFRFKPIWISLLHLCLNKISYFYLRSLISLITFVYFFSTFSEKWIFLTNLTNRRKKRRTPGDRWRFTRMLYILLNLIT